MESRIMQTAIVEQTARRNAIEIESLTKRYGDNVVLDGLTLDIPEKSIFGFLGPNGAGKTTTIKLLLGLSRPSAGTARLFGLDNETESLAIRRRIGYLAQDPLFYPHMTPRETLAFACRFFYSGPKKAIDHRIEETLELVGLADKADRPIKGFSGGERQRLGIAQAQVNYPDLLVLDEPAAALDPVGRRDVLDIMERLRDHTTIFYSTHILDDVQRVSDRVAILDGGRLVADAATDDLLNGDSISYEVIVRGDGQSAASALLTRSWTQDLRAIRHANLTTLTVDVADERTAENELLRAVMADGTTVVGFGRKKTTLEDAFLGLVERQEN